MDFHGFLPPGTLNASQNNYLQYNFLGMIIKIYTVTELTVLQNRNIKAEVYISIIPKQYKPFTILLFCTCKQSCFEHIFALSYCRKAKTGCILKPKHAAYKVEKYTQYRVIAY